MADSDLAAALRRRTQARENLKRYWGSHGFNRLAERGPGAPRTKEKRDLTLHCRIAFLLAGGLFLLAGLYYCFF